MKTLKKNYLLDRYNIGYQLPLQEYEKIAENSKNSVKQHKTLFIKYLFHIFEKITTHVYKKYELTKAVRPSLVKKDKYRFVKYTGNSLREDHLRGQIIIKFAFGEKIFCTKLFGKYK